MRALPLTGLLLLLSARGTAAEWPQFRGPDGSGVVADANLPLQWSETDGIVWKTPIAGRGWSSPVVTGDSIWLTTAEETKLTDAERVAFRARNVLNPLGSAMDGASKVALSAVEVNAKSGAVVRTLKLLEVEWPDAIHGLNSYASPTPVIADGKCVFHFGRFGTVAIDLATGKELWKREFKIDHAVGPGSSPAVVGDVVIIPCDGTDEQYVVGIDLATGDQRWKTARPPIRQLIGDMRKAYSTPLAIDAAGRTIVVVPGAQWFVAYDPTSGDELWRVDHGDGFSNVPRPVFDGERLYLCSGYTRASLWAVRPDGHGDVGATHVPWKAAQQVPTMPSPVTAEGRVYMISDNGVATCLDAATGKLLWRERIGGNFSSSPLLGAGRVYFSSHEGVTTAVAASEEFEKLAANELDGQIMASPAVVDGDLLLRTDAHLYRIGE